MNGAAPRRLRATTAMRRVSRSGRSPGGWDAPRPPSRRTCTTHLMLTKDLRIAARTNAGFVPPRAVYGAPAHKAALAYARRHGVAAPAQRLIPSSARAYAGGATCALIGSRASRRRSGWDARAGSAACRPVSIGAPNARASRRDEARLQGTGGRESARHTHTSASARAERLQSWDRTNLPPARRVRRRRRAGRPQPRQAAPRDRRHRCCEIVRRGSAAPRAGVRLAAPSCSERTTQRSGGGHRHASTRLLQPWRSSSTADQRHGGRGRGSCPGIRRPSGAGRHRSASRRQDAHR
jgi:hypothetical protein